MGNVLRSVLKGSEQAPVVLLFGGNAERKEELMQLISSVYDITLIGLVEEADGLALIREIGKDVNLVYIDGTYSEEVRNRIKDLATYINPHVELSEPGHKYPYSDAEILDDVWTKLENKLAIEIN